MEREAISYETGNGVEKTLPAPEVETGKADHITVSKLVEKRKEMLQGLNSIKAEQEATKDRLRDLDISRGRTEGALITLTGLIADIDPSVAQQLQQGG